MSQNSSNRRRRGRGGRSGGRSPNRSSGRGVSYQSALGQYQQGEDPSTFWARSNARLGIDPDDSTAGRKGKGPIEFACAVCGVFVSLERWPKERQGVRCDSCKNACGTLLTGDDLDIASELARDAKGNGSKYDGVPEMTEEDLEAITEMKALADRMGNGRSGNRKRGSGGANRRRRRGSGGHNHGRNNQGESSGGGQNRRRRRRRGGRNGPKGDGAGQGSNSNKGSSD
ncbi:MAG: hypothetical protein VYA30_15725 [Myxococcota bacterium]|nr:hypothetical protein [Myxococcota bacterium]